ncbi:uncharacterized protein At1g24485-like [Nymphaea colorata]|nr:uncharacterized protein At1g24485-like [Nymphaea colorata]
MEKSFLILFLLMLTLINFLHVTLGAHADINIACGTTDPFADSYGNYWMGDDQFIQSGSTATVQNTSQYSQLLSTVRFFDDPNTNCYTIPILTQTNKIDVVAFFLYGNYDDKAQPPSFKLQIDDSEWADVETSMDDLAAYGMTYWPEGNNVSVCLARNETAGVPFISAIQMSTKAPSPDPSTEAPSPDQNTDTSPPIIVFNNIILAPAKASPNASENPSPNASPKDKFEEFIILVTLLPSGTFITLVVSVIAWMKKRKKNKKAHINSNSDVAGAANQQKSEVEDKSKDEV